jgi:hypothetical protein
VASRIEEARWHLHNAQVRIGAVANGVLPVATVPVRTHASMKRSRHAPVKAKPLALLSWSFFNGAAGAGPMESASLPRNTPAF